MYQTDVVLLLKCFSVTNYVYPVFLFVCDVGFSIELINCLFGPVF